MRIHIHTISEDGQQVAFENSANAFPILKNLEGEHACGFKSPVSARLTVMPFHDVFRIEGRISTLVSLDCSRCLGRFDMAIETEFSATYENRPHQEPEDDDAAEVELTRDQMGTLSFSGDVIDLTGEIAQQVVMSIPFQPLCSEKCQGLCAHCGANLNEGPCRCHAKEKEGPFSVLKNLKFDE